MQNEPILFKAKDDRAKDRSGPSVSLHELHLINVAALTH